VDCYCAMAADMQLTPAQPNAGKAEEGCCCGQRHQAKRGRVAIAERYAIEHDRMPTGSTGLRPAFSADISELDLKQGTSINFPEGKDKLMHFEIKIKPEEGTYKSVSYLDFAESMP